MTGSKIYHRKKAFFILCLFSLLFFLMGARIVYLMVWKSDYYSSRAQELHERERKIKAARGLICDRNGTVLAANIQVCTVSVVHSQIENPEAVIESLSQLLELDEKEVEKKVRKVSAREIIKSNVSKEKGDQIRNLGLPGVKVDEDYKRYYPYDELASKVLGFCGADNQGIVGLEVQYENVLSGIPGKILTLTDYKGMELENEAETREEPSDGGTLTLSLDVNIQKYVQQAAEKTLLRKNAKKVSIILMNPQNGEIYAMTDWPEYNLNEPFKLSESLEQKKESEKLKTQEALNLMWRNTVVNDTYEPGSTFKIVTAYAALSEGLVSLEDRFYCPGYRIVEDRRIRCHKIGGHGSEDFKEGVMNSCNPVFMDLGARLGREKTYEYWNKLGLFEKTGIDVPGEAGSIMHKLENIKSVELATMSFGQTFQITPLQLLRAASAVVNGGKLVTPHFAMKVTDGEKTGEEAYDWPVEETQVADSVSETMKEILEAVVSEGTGVNGSIKGYAIGGKTATSQKLPRSERKYISSFLGFAPAKKPIVMGLVLIDEPDGIYYGGTVAAPVMKEIFENILPYLGIQEEPLENEKENDQRP